MFTVYLNTVTKFYLNTPSWHLLVQSKMCLKLRKKKPERGHWHCCRVFIVNFERISFITCFYCWIWTSRHRLWYVECYHIRVFLIHISCRYTYNSTFFRTSICYKEFLLLLLMTWFEESNEWTFSYGNFKTKRYKNSTEVFNI